MNFDKPPRVIVALDNMDRQSVFSVINLLSPNICKLKIGSELFTRFGPALVKEVIAKGFEVFLDLKFHDIPNQVEKACLACSELNVWMLTLHISGGERMLLAAVDALKSLKKRPLLIGVTVLTSLDELDLKKLGFGGDIKFMVKHWAQLAKTVGLDGIVCSARELSDIKHLKSERFYFITPGIRIEDGDKQDQKRIWDPKSAIDAGADYLVVGRSIIQSGDPCLLIDQIQSFWTRNN